MTNGTCGNLLVVACDLDGCCNWCPYFHDCNPELIKTKPKISH